MRWFLLGSSLGAAGYLIGPWVLAKIARRYSANDVEIKGYRYRFEGSDEALRKRTEARRAQAAALKREAVNLETQDDRISKIHLVR